MSLKQNKMRYGEPPVVKKMGFSSVNVENKWRVNVILTPKVPDNIF